MTFRQILFLVLVGTLAGCGQNTPDTREVPAAQSAPVSMGTPSVADPIALGKSIFVRCAACHSVEAGVNGLGPSLHGIVGRPSASIPGFGYSKEMQGAKLTWDRTSLSAYLENPQAFIKDNKMVFPGLPIAKERDDLLAYLETLM